MFVGDDFKLNDEKAFEDVAAYEDTRYGMMIEKMEALESMEDSVAFAEVMRDIKKTEFESLPKEKMQTYTDQCHITPFKFDGEPFVPFAGNLHVLERRLIVFALDPLISAIHPIKPASSISMEDPLLQELLRCTMIFSVDTRSCVTC